MHIPAKWIYTQLRTGRILLDAQPSGAHLFRDAAEVINAVRSLRDHTVDQVDLRADQPHTEGQNHG